MFDQSKSLTVRLANPTSGWMQLEIVTSQEQVSEFVSYTPNDFSLELTTALSLAIQGMEGIAIAYCEPTTLEFLFSPFPDGAELVFQITRYANEKRGQSDSNVVLTVQASTQEVILPFWRALRNLEGRISAEDYQEHFRREFPAAGLQRLTKMVRERIKQ